MAEVNSETELPTQFCPLMLTARDRQTRVLRRSPEAVTKLVDLSTVRSPTGSPREIAQRLSQQRSDNDGIKKANIISAYPN